MRFCPFCSAENADELAVCQACGRRLPPLPPRRAGSKGPPTGVQLPPRPAAPPRKPSPSSPPATTPGVAPPVPVPVPVPQPVPVPASASAPVPVSAPVTAPVPAPVPAPATAPVPVPVPAPAPVPAPVPASAPVTAPRLRPGPSQPPPIPRAPSPGPVPAAADTARTPALLAIEPTRAPTGLEPPPTRIHRADADRPFALPKVVPVPEIPEPGLLHAARYASMFWRARWQRRGAIKQLGIEIKQDTEALDQVLGALGRAARGARIEGRVFSAENAAITAAEERIAQLQHEAGDVEGRKAEENSKFVDVERERNEKLAEAERQVEEAQRELAQLEGQRRGLRDKRKELERRQKAHLKAAEDQDRQAGAAQLGDQRTDLRRAAEDHRREAAALEPERQDCDRKLAALERPIGETAAKLDAAKAELDAAKRSLNDAREGHTHRLAELDAEHKRKQREVALAESEIQRRLVTLGTLVNLTRMEDPNFTELYERIDRLRGAITARTTEIEKLTAEREAYDRGTLVRGVAAILGALMTLIALIVIFRAIL